MSPQLAVARMPSDGYGCVPFQLGEVPLVMFSGARFPSSILCGLWLSFDLYKICNLFALLTKVSVAFGRQLFVNYF